MTKKVHNTTPVQSYPIQRSDYIIKNSAERTTDVEEYSTTKALIVERRDFVDESSNSSTPIYLYYVYAFSKALPNDEASSDPKAEEELNNEGNSNKDWSKVKKRSLLYCLYDTQKYNENQVVFVEKEGNNIQIIGPVAPYTEGTATSSGIIEVNNCSIDLNYVTMYFDAEGNEVEPPKPSIPRHVTVDVPGGMMRTVTINTAPSEQSTSIQKLKAISNGSCSESTVEEINKRLKSESQEYSKPENFIGYKTDFPILEPRQTDIEGRRYEKGKFYWGGTMKANRDLVIPLWMEKDLKRMSVNYYAQFSEPLKINSAFRDHAHQERLYNAYQTKTRLEDSGDIEGREYEGVANSNPAAQPGRSKHNFGYAVDFQITDGSKGMEKVSDFKELHYLEGKYDSSRQKIIWPKTFRWLYLNAGKYNFFWPKGVQSGESFEAWHWEYRGA